MVFVDRVDAGRRLATRLQRPRGKPVVVLGLPRGRVPVAFEVARALDAPLDVIVVRKLVLDLNRRAQALLRCESRLAVVPGATHLFEEPGTLQAAAELARDWFTRHLAAQPQPVA